MALLIDGDAMSFRAALYGRPAETTVNFLQQQFNDPSRALNFANNSFFDRARTMFETNFNEEAMAKYDSVRRNLHTVWDMDDIRPLLTLDAMQQAKPVMQRWLMANPFLRNLHKQGRIEAFGDSYIDHKNQGVGEDHYDYQLARSGFATFNDETEWEATTYAVELLEGDVEPTFLEKLAIDQTWAAAEIEMLFGSRDVTSPENNQWG